jgi:hypothetical protein
MGLAHVSIGPHSLVEVSVPVRVEQQTLFLICASQEIAQAISQQSIPLAQQISQLIESGVAVDMGQVLAVEPLAGDSAVLVLAQMVQELQQTR